MDKSGDISFAFGFSISLLSFQVMPQKLYFFTLSSYFIFNRLIKIKFHGTMFNKYFSIILILNGTATYMDSTNPYKMNKVFIKKGFTAPIIIGTRLLSLFDDDSEFLETRCRLDRFFYLPLVGIFLSWCVTSIIFRSNGLKGVREL